MFWYCARVKVNSEEQAQANLERQNYLTYLPMVISDRRKKETTTERMFPGYIFVALTPGEDNFQPIQNTRGVVQLIRFGLHPATVRSSVIDNLRALEDENGVHRIDQYDYTKNDAVKITDGPFKDYKATVLKTKRGRVEVLLDFLQKETRLTLTYRQLQAA